jgi:hypothetical protein
MVCASTFVSDYLHMHVRCRSSLVALCLCPTRHTHGIRSVFRFCMTTLFFSPPAPDDA